MALYVLHVLGYEISVGPFGSVADEIPELFHLHFSDEPYMILGLS